MSERSDSFTAIRATYRLQFHRDFTFRNATALVPYLASLGVSHIYASPIMESRPGSTHGYDGNPSDPGQIGRRRDRGIGDP